MPSYDIKQQRKELYAPKEGAITLVGVPPLGFLMVDGHGDPNTSPDYREAVEALFATSYAVRSATRTKLAQVHTVGPLEGLWSAADLDTFRTRDKGAWDWTMMIVQPEWVTEELVADGVTASCTKSLPALETFASSASPRAAACRFSTSAPTTTRRPPSTACTASSYPRTVWSRRGDTTRSVFPTHAGPSRRD